MVYVRFDPKKFHDSGRFLKKSEVKEIFKFGRVFLRHDYEKTKMKRYKKKKKGYVGVKVPKSRILREFNFR